MRNSSEIPLEPIVRPSLYWPSLFCFFSCFCELFLLHTALAVASMGWGSPQPKASRGDLASQRERQTSRESR